MNLLLKPWVALALAAVTPVSLAAAELPGATKSFLGQHCTDCHDADTRKGELDLTSLAFDPANPKNFATWVKVHDRVGEGEMPPKKKARPDTKAMENFLATLATPLQLADRKRETNEGRSTWRRLNRYEYENTLRDLLDAPWLQVKEMLPEDGEAFRFNKVGDALDVSHVQMARYLSAAEYALREVLAKQLNRPDAKVTRYYTREQRTFTGKMKYSVFNTAPERATFPVLGTKGQPDVRAGKAPMSAGEADPKMREEEGVGVVASSYEPIELRFNGFVAAQAGHYKLRFSAHSVWVGPGTGNKWYIPDLDNVSAGRRSEPITIYSETPPRLLRRLGAFDVAPEPTVQELDVHLLKGETIRPDAARFFRSRPGSTRWHNPLAEPDGQPGVSFRWMEVEGPIIDEWPMAGHKLMFGSLPLKETEGGKVTVLPADPAKDSERLLRAFMKEAYRRPVENAEIQRFLGVINGAMKSGSDFTDAMIAGYSAVLCSPEFVCLEEKPGKLDDYALASRLSYFIWNTAPDAQLRAAAAKGQLRKADTLRAETERLLGDPRSHRFINAFLDYWLDLRRVEATSPDSALYNDYYLDDLLVESATEETRAFFTELIKGDLPSRNIVASDFAMVNERLANHYGLSPVEGVALRRTRLPADSPRGGLMTQASVLKVTANGTTTSPVVRGAWIMERILGKPPPKPPPSVPAVEPDIRGATTIRQQLAQHRDQESCAACHAKIDPAGFALENFDVVGGWRDQYRALGDGERVKGWGKGGQPHEFHWAQKVDGSGELPDGRKFADVRELKNLLSKDERQIARNLAQQLVVYATGAPVSFGDRREIEEILDHASASHWGVRSLIHEVVQSALFRVK